VNRDTRVHGNPTEPPHFAPGGAERWIGYLDWLRAEIASTVLAMCEDDRRAPRVPSGWTPIELLAHVLHMEQRWFVWGFLGETVSEPWGDWNVPDPAAPPVGGTARWAVPDGVTTGDLLDRLDTVGERTREILRGHPLDARAAVGGRFTADPPTLDWICFHVLVEYARHAGHLDIVVELAAGE
jgi:hypothetical protein